MTFTKINRERQPGGKGGTDRYKPAVRNKGGGGGEREREKERQTGRQTDRQTDRFDSLILYSVDDGFRPWRTLPSGPR